MVKNTAIPEGLRSDFDSLWQQWSVLAEEHGIELSAVIRAQLRETLRVPCVHERDLVQVTHGPVGGGIEAARGQLAFGGDMAFGKR